MERFHSVRALNYALILSTAFIVSSVILIKQSQALTASYGQPYHGRLENGVQFPNQFPGYHLRDGNRSYTTPEVVGALLDAIEAVRVQFPDTCDLFIGDFSMGEGGSANHHRSHQNGRDVDIGMYAKGNRPLDTFAQMGEDNLDAAKTWCLIENIIRSQRVQYIFLDRRIQKVLYDYAVTRGYDQPYLDRVFGNVRGSLIQHVRNHSDHIHIRFFTPWSTLAAHIGEGEAEKRMVVDMAQQSYLPTKVNYYVNGSEHGLDAIAQSFGVTRRDLCRWNRLSPSAVPVPGSCLVFYKRSFESESVHLARSLQPGFIAQAPRIRMAALRSESPVSTATDTGTEDTEPTVREKRAERPEPAAPRQFKQVQTVVYKVKKGDTLDIIAKRNKTDVKALCRLNGITKTTRLQPGQSLKTGTRTIVADAGRSATDARKKGSSSSAICFSSDPRKPNSPTAAYYTVGKGDTLSRISKKSGISVDSLCQLNGLKRNTGLKPGQKIKLTQANLRVKPSVGSSAACKVPGGKTSGAAPAVKGKPAPQAKGAREAKAAVKGNAKAAAKTAPVKPGQKVAAKKSAPAKSAKEAKASAKANSKASAKGSAVKPGQKVAAKQSASSKSGAKSAAGKSTASAKSAVAGKPGAKPAVASKSGAKPNVKVPAEAKKGAQKKAVEAKKAGKPAPAAAQKKTAQAVGQLAKGR
ncbi:MAG: penicillin-insensitive murein endopeptidase [Syntrophobacteraceae bacterium]